MKKLFDRIFPRKPESKSEADCLAYADNPEMAKAYAEWLKNKPVKIS